MNTGFSLLAGFKMVFLPGAREECLVLPCMKLLLEEDFFFFNITKMKLSLQQIIYTYNSLRDEEVNSILHCANMKFLYKTFSGN